MSIAINFKNKSIVVDGYSCLCDNISALEDDWVSLEINDANEVRLYRVGIITTLNDISFINPWVDYALNAKKAFEDTLIEQEAQRLDSLNSVKLNEDNSVVWALQHEKQQAKIEENIIRMGGNR
jgi:hypothetical protein